MSGPAVSLVRGLPIGQDADILLLDHFDARDILFTCYLEEGLLSRKLDVTWLNSTAPLAARNVFLFILLLNDQGIWSSDDLWSIYWGLDLSETQLATIRDETEKLLPASASLQAWNDSCYGSVVHFCNEESLRGVNQAFKGYLETSGSRDSTEGAKKLVDDDGVRTSLLYRSGGPLSLLHAKELQEADKHFRSRDGSADGSHPNPLLQSIGDENSEITAENPIAAFQLGTNLANLAPGSPLSLESASETTAPQLIEAAKLQFAEWLKATKVQLRDSLTLRFAISTPSVFCHELYVVSVTDSSAQGPTAFDIVDSIATSQTTSNDDMLSTVTLIRPLLKDTPAAYFSTITKWPPSDPARHQKLVESLTQEGPNGLVQSEHWTNVTATAYATEALLTAGKSIPIFLRQTWRPNKTFMGSSVEESEKITVTPGVDEDESSGPEQKRAISSLIGRVDFISENGKSILSSKTPMKLVQISPFQVNLVVGTRATYPIHYPAPVLKEGSKTRIARTSGYVEMIMPLARPLDIEAFPNFIYPIILSPEGIPVPLNILSLNLDKLPILSVEEQDRKANSWLNTLVSNQFSTRERVHRQRLADRSSLPDEEIVSLRLDLKETIHTMFNIAAGLQGGQTGLFALADRHNGNQILIFIRAIRLDGAAGSVVADAALLPITHELIKSGNLETFLLLLRTLEICSITVSEEEIKMWKHILPAFAERCRTWTHGADCEYKAPGAVLPLSLKMGEPFLCSCGNGHLPEDYMMIPEWDEAAKHAVRVAISPTFAVPSVEPLIDEDMIVTAGGIEELMKGSCRCCGKTEAMAGKKLLRCSGCKEAMYCDAECQRQDWKKHRMEHAEEV